MGLALEVLAGGESVRAADAEVEEFLARSPDAFAQHAPGWREVVAPLGPDRPCLLLAREGTRLAGILPAYLFAGALGSILTSCPQAGALGGVATGQGERDGSLHALLIGGFLELARAHDCALASLLSNPFDGDRELCAASLEPDFVLDNEAQVLDMREPSDADGLPLVASENVRRNLRRAQASRLFTDDDASRENVLQWHAIHCARALEIGARPLPYELFERARVRLVPAGAARFVFVRHEQPGGEMIAGGFYLLNRRVIDAFMPSMSSAAAALSPMHFLHASVIRWARERGLRYYNWQASPPAGGVAGFKRQFGSRDVPYAWLTRVTGDASRILASTPAAVREAYAGHFVLPFDRVGRPAPGAPVTSSRAQAWAAGEAEPG